MNDDRHNPADRPPSDDLSARLREAVDAVRRQPAPPEALDRALQRAREVQGMKHTAPRRDWRMMFVAVASLAAAVALAVWLGTGPYSPATGDGPAVAVAPPEKTDHPAGDRPPADEGRAAPDKGASEAAGAATMQAQPAEPAPTLPAPPAPPGPAGLSAPAMERFGGKSDSATERGGAAGSGTGAAGRRMEMKTTPDGGDLGKKDAVPGFAPTRQRGDSPAPAPMPAAPMPAKPGDGPRDESLKRAEPESLREAEGAPRPLIRDKEEMRLKTLQEGLKPDTQRRKTQGEDRKGLADDRAGPAGPAPATKPLAQDGKEDKAKDADKKSGMKKEADRPQVWKRNGPPTFARVYIGDGNSLELVSLHVTVTVEGSRARTLVDHVFRNPHDRQLEGTFEYPLPTGASPSYFAMFLGQTRDTVPPRFARRGQAAPLPDDALARLTPAELVKQVSVADWGRLQEARVVSKQKALETYEEVVRGRIDPALMEYAGGNTFRGRVFPIPAKGYNRVLIAYEEPLTATGDRLQYRFPLPDCHLAELKLTVNAHASDCKEPAFEPKDAKKQEGGSFLAYSKVWNGQGPGGDAVFSFRPPNPNIQAISARHGEGGPIYLYARVQPELKVQQARPFASRAIFLLDTSLSEYPDRFDLNVRLIRAILEADPDIKQFNVLTFNVGTAWVEPKGWLDNTPAGREELLKRLDGLVLEGATDFGAALETLALDARMEKDRAVDLFVLSDGQVTWGEGDAQTLVSRFEGRCAAKTRFNCYRTGLGAENLELYGALTRRGGGVFNCLAPTDVKAAATAHRNQCLQVESVRFVGGPPASDLLIAGRQAAVYPGGDLVVATRFGGPGKTTLVVEGTFNGQKFAGEYPVEVKGDGELAARGWGEIAVASLLALNDPKLESLATAYSQEFGIGSRVASFLVLENDADYKRFNLEEERGKTLSGDMAAFLSAEWAKLGRGTSPRESYLRFLETIEPRVHLRQGPNAAHVNKLLALLGDKDFDLPDAALRGALLHREDVPPAYLEARERDRRDANAYITEAKRRAAAGDADGAARVLSSVIELHPTRDDALRLVGYRLLDLKQAAQAARLFSRVQRQRPFEPHSYRDLARSLEECGLHGLAAVQYETVLAGTWHNRFGDSMKAVAREEYVQMMREAIRRKAVTGALADHFGNRLEGMAGEAASGDLRVTISWNTDATDVDLWVIEPDGTKCFYSHNRTKNGGELSQDQTQGYGPERYRAAGALPGAYRILVHYYRANPNLIAGETHVNVVITRKAGTPQETVERRTVILKKQGEAVEVGKVDF